MKKWSEPPAEPLTDKDTQPKISAPIIPVLTKDGDEIPINFAEAFARFRIGKEAYGDIYLSFNKSLPGKIKVMREALDEGNTQELFRQVHSLKGVAANLCAGPITRLVQELEQMGMRDETENVASVLSQLEYEAGRLDMFCREEFDFSKDTSE